jgi:putative membrane protein
MKTAMTLACTVALGLLCVAGSQAASQRLSAQDRSFLMKASQGGNMEVQLGQLAVSKHDGRRVQQFGQRMIQDHSAANNKLMTVAANVRVLLPTDPRRAMGPQGRALYSQLAPMNGDQFARAYMTDMVTAHRKDISLFRREARNGRNPLVRQFARNTLPTLEDHLAMAEPLYAEVTGRPMRMYAHRRMGM